MPFGSLIYYSFVNLFIYLFVCVFHFLLISFLFVCLCCGHLASEYGLFLSDDVRKQGVWLESGRNLGYYLLRNHDILEYRRKLRTLRVRMLDGAVKTILVDDSQPVSQLMVVICTKIGITNHEEYGLVREENDQQNENLPDNKTGTLTLRRKFAEKDRDAKMESLRKKLKTDDESKCHPPFYPLSHCSTHFSLSIFKFCFIFFFVFRSRKRD